jgi:AraC-like DNA-binding protein
MVTTDTSVDVLANAFSGARTGAVVFAHVRCGAPWKLDCPPASHAGFHIVERGHCWLTPDDGSAPIQLVEHDIVLVTNGAGHSLADAPASSARPESVSVLAAAHRGNGQIVTGRGGPETVLVCGGYLLEERLAAPVLWNLPPFVHVTNAHASGEVRAAVALLLAELGNPRSGSPTMVNRLADVLLVHVLRASVRALADDKRAWLVELQDGPVARALGLLHKDPAASWTVETLAGSVGLSRAAFGRQFRALTGEPPRVYVSRTRMERAARLLRETDATVAEVGARVAYSSEYAFNRAFCRHHGISPGRYRSRSRSTGAPPPALAVAAQAPTPHGSLTTNNQVPSV